MYDEWYIGADTCIIGGMLYIVYTAHVCIVMKAICSLFNEMHFTCIIYVLLLHVCMYTCRYSKYHYSYVIMGAMTSQITSLTIVYSTVYSGTDKKKISKFRVTGLCARNSNVTGEFPVEMTSNAENVSIWWRHHVCYMWHAMFLWTFVYHRENKTSLFVYLFIDIIIVWLILPGLLITMCRITITMTS